jgi:hypothetical protein
MLIDSKAKITIDTGKEKEKEGKDNSFYFRGEDEKRPNTSNYNNNRRYERKNDNVRGGSREKKESRFDFNRKGENWECFKCHSNNYPHRTECFKCGIRKPSNREPENNDKRGIYF